jgi:hypothetical protein
MNENGRNIKPNLKTRRNTKLALCKNFVQKSFNSKISTRLMYAIQSIPIEHLILNFFFFLNEIREFDN